ncbi:MAG: transposase [Methylocapsa sp.]|nr:transposase [Methylocapsa sp.]
MMHLLPDAELFNEEVFDNLTHARQALSRWRNDYSNLRPHWALGRFMWQKRAARLSSWMAPCPARSPNHNRWSIQPSPPSQNCIDNTEGRTLPV